MITGGALIGVCETVQPASDRAGYSNGDTTAWKVSNRGGRMSALNGDRARFHKDRVRKLNRRQRIQALLTRLGTKPAETASDTVTRSVIAAFVDATPARRL